MSDLGSDYLAETKESEVAGGRVRKAKSKSPKRKSKARPKSKSPKRKGASRKKKH